MLRKTLVMLAVASTLAACGKSPGEPPKPVAAAESKLLISPEDVLTVQTDTIASGPVITGSVQPERKADVRAEVSAIVLQVLKENGDAVKRGDVLVRLDETAIRDSMTSAEEATRAARQSLDGAERVLERTRTLRTSGMMSTQALEDAEIKRNNAQSDLAAAKTRSVQAQQQLQRTVIRAPFDGVVSERKVSNGDTAQVGKELIKVIDPASMRFEGLVSADKIGEVKVGLPVRFRINGYPGKDFVGKVRRVDPAADAVTRQVAVLVDFAQQTQPRVAGLYAEGRIESDSVAALMLPESALIRAGDASFAWRLSGKILTKTPLTIGVRDARTGQWEIRRGLAAGDTVMRNPGSGFKDGQKVELAAAKAVSPAAAALPQTAAAQPVSKGN
jgi:membrane fusion protein (multidrug efflux system)